MKTRLQPVSIIFKPLPGVVKEISRTLNKKVKLETSGEKTELDRSILNGIKDPLTHVLRNSLDHGIEPYEDRVKTDKPDEATIKLKAYHEGSQVVIEISDDGRGVNVESVKAKALENGLMSAEELGKLTEQEICRLIFMAGFSTAEQVSEVSGRGVGMDVVRSNIENLGGHIELESLSGKGTILKFKIPLTLAIIPALVVEAGGVKYSIPQESLVEMVLVKTNDPQQKFEELNGTTVFRLRGKILPVVNLNEILDLPASEDQSETLHVIVLNTGGNLFGLVVTLLHDIEEIVVKSLDHFLENHPLFSGATILGDGSISLILDTLLIAERFRMSNHRGGQEQLQKNEVVSIAAEGQLLTFHLSPQQIFGVMLDGVYRLENVKSSRIESLAGKWFLQYRGGVLPLISSWQLMEIEQDSLPEDVNIIVFVEDGQEMGLMVGTIDDTMPLTHPIVTDIVVDPRFLGSSIVNRKVITVLNLKYMSQQILSMEASAKERVLLWDDSDLRGEHADKLRQQGYDVEEVATKQEADELLDAQVIDIVVTTPNLNVDELEAFSKDHGSNVSMMSYQDASVEDLDYQEKLDPSQLSEGLKDLGQSK
jgi:two-component system chemotaxis sensor kinase CheA